MSQTFKMQSKETVDSYINLQSTSDRNSKDSKTSKLVNNYMEEIKGKDSQFSVIESVNNQNQDKPQNKGQSFEVVSSFQNKRYLQKDPTDSLFNCKIDNIHKTSENMQNQIKVLATTENTMKGSNSMHSINLKTARDTQEDENNIEDNSFTKYKQNNMNQESLFIEDKNDSNINYYKKKGFQYSSKFLQESKMQKLKNIAKKKHRIIIILEKILNNAI